MVIFEGNLGSVFDFEDMVETWKIIMIMQTALTFTIIIINISLYDQCRCHSHLNN